MNDPVTVNLEQFQEQDYTVRICRLLFENVPKAPPFVFYRDLKGAAQRLGSMESGELPSSIVEAANSEMIKRTIWVADKLDVADAALVAYTGVSNVFSWLSGRRPGGHTFESDRQQAIDAVLKVIGVSYLTTKLFEGSIRERTAQLLSLPAGREMVLYLCVAEIALPSLDNVIAGGWEYASRHLQSGMADGVSRFGQITGERTTEELKGSFNEMNKVLGQTMSNVQGRLGPVADRLTSAMPAILNVTDSVTGLLASSLDTLPIWRFLGARLAAEASVQRGGLALPSAMGVDPFGVTL